MPPIQYEPRGHATGAPVPAGQWCPEGHSAHESTDAAPASARYRRAGHGTCVGVLLQAGQ